MLSLIGVAVAVCAITTVVGLGAVAKQSMIESRTSGRAGARRTLDAIASMADGSPPTGRTHAMRPGTPTLERYDIDFASRIMYSSQTVQFIDGARDVQTTGVDAALRRDASHPSQLDGALVHRRDAERLAPAIIVNEVFYDRLGRPDLATHPTVTLLGQQTPTTAVIVGVTRSRAWDTEPTMYHAGRRDAELVPCDRARQPTDPTRYMIGRQPPTYELWVPTGISSELITSRCKRDVQASARRRRHGRRQPPGLPSPTTSDPFLPMKLMVGGVAGARAAARRARAA